MLSCGIYSIGLQHILKNSILSLLLLIIYDLNGQELPKPQIAGSHEVYLQLLQNSEEDIYKAVTKQYEAYLLLHPEDIGTRIEHCRFIGLAMYDSYEEYNPNQAQFDQCLDSLKKDYGKDLRVMSFASEFQYGDSALYLLEQINERIEDGEDVPEGLDLADVYQRTAYQYSYQDDHQNAIYFADKASKYNDTLNLSYFIASQNHAAGEDSRALDVLLSGEDSTLQNELFNQRAILALVLGDSEMAIRNFKWALKDETNWINQDKYAEALLNVGNFEEAKKHLKVSIGQYWKNAEQLFDLFDYDLQYMPADTAVQTYHRLVKEGWEMDAFGISKLRLIYHTGRWELGMGDFWRLMAVTGVLLVLFVLPYLWILPVQFLGQYRRIQERLGQDHFRWGLRHFWWASFGYLAVNFIIMLVFYNEDVIRFFFYDLEEMMVPQVDAATAWSSLFFCLGLLTVVVLMTRMKDVQLLNCTKWTHGKTFGIALLSFFSLRLALGIYLQVTGFSLQDISNAGFLSIDIEIDAMFAYLGPLLTFIIIAVVVPIYEEFLFRGIILSACEKYVGFWPGNVIQAVIFAVIHNSLELMPFYLIFGIVAGVLRQNSQSLMAPIYMHVLNNALAIFAIGISS